MIFRYTSILLFCFIPYTALSDEYTEKEIAELNQYGSLYRNLIQDNFYFDTRDPEFKGKRCKVNFKLLPTTKNVATLKEVKILSGDAKLCKLTEIAVRKVKSFPLPKTGRTRDSLMNVNLTVAPQY